MNASATHQYARARLGNLPCEEHSHSSGTWLSCSGTTPGSLPRSTQPSWPTLPYKQLEFIISFEGNCNISLQAFSILSI